MQAKMGTLWKGARPLIGTIVGVGIFGLPYAFAHAGYAIGLLELLVVGGLNLVVLFLYADLVLLRHDHGRFGKIVGEDLGPMGRVLASFAFFGSHIGALVAYILIGGQFAYAVLSPLLHGQVLTYQLAFWLLGSLVMLGGLFFVAKVQSYIVPCFFFLVAVLVFAALPHINLEHLTSVYPDQAILPLGVVLFAFSGLSAIPEMRDILGKDKAALRGSIIFAKVLVALLYIVFTFAIVGVTGLETSSEAIAGVGKVAGPLFVLLGSLIGLFTVFGAYMTIGVAMTNSLFYDHKLRYLTAWSVVVGIPLLIFAIGARDFIGVIGFTGGVLSSLIGMLLILAYEKVRLSHALPKRAMGVPQWLVGLSFLMFVAMFILTITDAVA